MNNAIASTNPPELAAQVAAELELDGISREAFNTGLSAARSAWLLVDGTRRQRGCADGTAKGLIAQLSAAAAFAGYYTQLLSAIAATQPQLMPVVQGMLKVAREAMASDMTPAQSPIVGADGRAIRRRK